LFLTAAPCDPDNAQKVVDEAKTIFEAFAKEGPSAEELENAQKQIANNLDTQMREPRYWLSILQNFTFHEMRLEDQKNQKEAYNNYTAKQVQAVFKKYYTPRREFSVTAVPVQAETGKEEEKEKAAAAVE
jgi:predicted Zn-dependent peptidase